MNVKDKNKNVVPETGFEPASIRFGVRPSITFKSVSFKLFDFLITMMNHLLIKIIPNTFNCIPYPRFWVAKHLPAIRVFFRIVLVGAKHEVWKHFSCLLQASWYKCNFDKIIYINLMYFIPAAVTHQKPTGNICMPSSRGGTTTAFKVKKRSLAICAQDL